MTHLNEIGQRVVRAEGLKDGTGRARIHWLEHTPDGPIRSPSGEVLTSSGPLAVGGFVGRVACRPALKSDLPVFLQGETHILMRSDDPRAVTCPDCRALKSYWQAMLDIVTAAGGTLEPDDVIRAAAAGVGVPAPAQTGGA